MAVRILRPWPAIGLIRRMFEKSARATVAEMVRHLPAAGPAALDEQLSVPYGVDATGPTLSVFTPITSGRKAAASPVSAAAVTAAFAAADAGANAGADARSAALPTVVWVHGGAWISGLKEDVDPYLRLLAARGFTTVSLDYTLSPETTYPTALAELNSALGFLSANAERFGVDPQRFVLAGDSAGASLVSQLAVITTDPEYAATVGIEPALRAEQVRAVILNCGIYDVRDIVHATGLGGWGFRQALRAYLGQKAWAQTAGAGQLSTLNHVTAAFPPTWISGGNGDPLTRTQSKPLAERLASLGVPVTTVFYADDHEPSIPHEYQFHLDLTDARAALESTVEFLTSVTGIAG
jgi:acetyl esterase/lipase